MVRHRAPRDRPRAVCGNASWPRRRAGQATPQGRAQIHGGVLGRSARITAIRCQPKPVLWSSSGTFSYVFTEAVPDGVPGHWRAQFDFTGAGPTVVDMRLYLKNGEQTLSETWLYQFHIV